MSKTQLQNGKKYSGSGKKEHQVVVKNPGPSKIPRCGGGPDLVLPLEGATTPPNSVSPVALSIQLSAIKSLRI
jgi:hypothetical protein